MDLSYARVAQTSISQTAIRSIRFVTRRDTKPKPVTGPRISSRQTSIIILGNPWNPRNWSGFPHYHKNINMTHHDPTGERGEEPGEVWLANLCPVAVSQVLDFTLKKRGVPEGPSAPRLCGVLVP